MRIYKDKSKKDLEEVYCNNCGRKITVENGIVRQGILSIDYKWEYFSGRDGMQHSFDICEQCYDKLINNFKYPVTETEYSELL